MIFKTHKILGTNTTVYSVWEPTHGEHYVVAAEKAMDCVYYKYGQVGTRRVPLEIENMPDGECRIAAVENFRKKEHRRAYDAILTKHPELKTKKTHKAHGRIEVSEGEKRVC